MSGEKAYVELLQKVLNTGEKRQTRNATTYSLFGETLEFDISERFPLLTTKRVYWNGVMKELLWFLKCDTNSKHLEEKKVNIWKGNSSREYLDSIGLKDNAEGDCGPVYGYQWRNFGGDYISENNPKNGNGIDQLNIIIKLIKKDPTSRRIFMSAWNPTQMREMCLPPCHVSYQFYVHGDGRLDCQLYQRSADLFLGVPFNIASTALLTYIIANITGKKPGKIRIIIGDAHIYENHIDVVKQQIAREIRELPTLDIKNTHEKPEQYDEEDFEITDYKPHPTLKAEMVV